ncbi:XrtA system polysaccharide chain length determinant [Sphingorhabdus arenilitoris]|uniref:XrtA system polysaccharide chain length determinant n=1 Tax=Sphingorhabdus arenilitoris TaxID=1490041 RepID=A0ABV8RE95_9SPHN
MTGLYDEIRIAIHSVWNRRWLALAIAWGFCLLGWLGVAMIPNSYESEARVQVQTQEFLSNKVGISANDRARNIQQLEQTLTSSTNLEKVIRGTELGQTVVSDREMAGKVEGLRAKIEVKSEQDNFFAITVKQSSPKLARDVVQKLIDVAEEDSIAGDRKETGQTLRFLEKQIQDRQVALQEAEAKRVEFETKNLGLLPGIGSVSQRLASARAEITQIDSQLVQARSALAALNSQLAGTPQSLSTPSFGGGGASASPSQVALSQALADLGAMRARGLTDNHPDVIAQKNQVANLRAQAKASPSTGGGSGSFSTPNPAYSSLQSLRAERQASATALASRKAALEGEISQLTSQQTAEPGVAAEMTRINRDYDVLKKQYDDLVAERNNVALRGDVETQTDAVQFRVINRPTLSSVPAAPNRPLLLAMVLFAGIGAGAGAAFALGHLQTSFPTAAKLERASGLPVIGSISQMLSSEAREERRRKLKLFYTGSFALVGVFALLLVAEFVQRGITA